MTWEELFEKIKEKGLEKSTVRMSLDVRQNLDNPSDLIGSFFSYMAIDKNGHCSGVIDEIKTDEEDADIGDGSVAEHFHNPEEDDEIFIPNVL